MQAELEVKLVKKLEGELREGMLLAKCRKCGCMKESLDMLGAALKKEASPAVTLGLNRDITRWQSEMEPIRYDCLGCEHCFPAVAVNAFNEAYPDSALADAVGCGFEVKEQTWPPVPGEYKVLCDGRNSPVAISTLGSSDLVDRLAARRPKEVCIVGKTETENIGIDKVIKNIVSNRAIRFLVLAGADPKGHLPGQTIISLVANGVDDRMRVTGSNGKRPILRNVTSIEVNSFRKQVKVVDLIGCEDIETIVDTIGALPLAQESSCGCAQCDDIPAVPATTEVPVFQATEPTKIQLDRSGYFVVMPEVEKGTILVEHYGYDDKHLRTIVGKDARSLYWTIIENNWVSLLSHSAYLGKELIKAELSMKLGFKYIQDGA